MNRRGGSQPDPGLDLDLALGFDRPVDVPQERIRSAWTTPEPVTQGFTPARTP